MRNLVAAEVAKLRTTRMAYGLLATALALTVVSVVASILTAGRAEGTFALDTPEGVRNALGAGGVTTILVLVLVLGILAMAGEFRHGTITPTLPDRAWPGRPPPPASSCPCGARAWSWPPTGRSSPWPAPGS